MVTKNLVLTQAAVRDIEAGDLDQKVLFVFAGDGPLLMEMRQEVKAIEMEQYFLFLGWVDDIFSLSYRASVLVLLSL